MKIMDKNFRITQRSEVTKAAPLQVQAAATL